MTKREKERMIAKVVDTMYKRVADSDLLSAYQADADYITFQQKGMTGDTIEAFHNGVTALTGFFSTKCSDAETIQGIEDILRSFNKAAYSILSGEFEDLHLALPIKPDSTDSTDIIMARIVSDMVYTLQHYPELIIRYCN